ncbi:MAG: AbrB/MazE/SpoVT family DNA-binding domain-containing protein [Oscillospiraceae bacterium]|nr:AbrB/MazE/SpoVT family DNA-binding domain-containing protein [Oscillospiraceae bacterium]MDD4592879.1 AbrB/MazE/SpoVT family DNA-binding domain-containing protein [Parabacteroides sp.]
MKEEIIRKLDDFGRIVLPAEYRNALGWGTESNISITHEGNRLILHTYQGSCFICSNENNLKHIRGKCICKSCIDELIE